MKYQTREVLAACYLGPNKHHGRMLSHVVEVDMKGQIVRVLCGRVSVLSIADRYAGDPNAAPTCERCVARLARANG